ncbi:MAG: TonB-dependent receptor [Bacteroidales bacterium]|nr:TonB-dependent receptor [Bacteroidales bacterium]
MRGLFIGLLILIASIAFGQSHRPDSTHFLPAIEITTTRTNIFLPGLKIEKIDSSLIQMRQSISIAALLSENSGALIRSYGTGGLATLSMRGTQTTQSGVFWNGFNLNQPNMGMADLSLIPVSCFDDVEVQYGGSGSVAGNGLIGGNLQLSNSKAFNQPLKSTLSLGIGSFGEANTSFKVSAGNKHISWSSSMNGYFDRNKFQYKNLSGNTEDLQHAVCIGKGVLNQVDILLTPKSYLSAGLWLQSSNREIPATLVMQSNDQLQEDQSLRSTLQYSYITLLSQFQVRSAFFGESLHFMSPMALIDALYKLRTLSLESDYKRIFGNATINLGVNTRIQKASVPYYKEKDENQKGAGLFISGLYNWKTAGWKAAVNLRKELEQGYVVPVCPSLSIEGKIFRTLTASFNVSRNFRVPTMNDRFWEPGGNPDLVPESSWNQELGFVYLYPANSSTSVIKAEINTYNMMIINLIQWVNLNSTVWTPKNVNKVWSRGVETKISYFLRREEFSSTTSVSYTYSPSTILDDGHQLIYIPVNRLVFLSNTTFRSYSGIIALNITGKRYVNMDNSDELPVHALLNLTLQKKIILDHTNFYLQFEIRNLLNTQYQVVKYYPEPGISFMTNIHITI